MRFTDDETLNLAEELSLAVLQLLFLHRDQLNEMFPDPTQAAKDRLAKLKKRAEAEKEKIDAIRHRQKRNKELEKIRMSHDKAREDAPAIFERKGTGNVTQILDASGKLVGSILSQGKNKTYLSAAGLVIARFIGGRTYDMQGRASGRGDLGLLVLGKYLVRSGPK